MKPTTNINPVTPNLPTKNDIIALITVIIISVKKTATINTKTPTPLAIATTISPLEFKIIILSSINTLN
jgi:hypothetical protein